MAASIHTATFTHSLKRGVFSPSGAHVRAYALCTVHPDYIVRFVVGVWHYSLNYNAILSIWFTYCTDYVIMLLCWWNMNDYRLKYKRAHTQPDNMAGFYGVLSVDWKKMFITCIVYTAREREREKERRIYAMNEALWEIGSFSSPSHHTLEQFHIICRCQSTVRVLSSSFASNMSGFLFLRHKYCGRCVSRTRRRRRPRPVIQPSAGRFRYSIELENNRQWDSLHYYCVRLCLV